MKKIVLLSIAMLAVLLTNAQKVTFYSAEFEEGVKMHIGLSADDEVQQNQTDTITSIDLSGLGIKDIRDVIYLPNVKSLDLSYNDFNDVQALVQMESLNYLDLKGNGLKDINILAYCNSSDIIIDVSYNNIEDFSCFFLPSAHIFKIVGIGLQQVMDAPYLDVYQLYADISDDEQPVITYRGYTNMSAATNLKYGSSSVSAKLDGNTYQVAITEGIAETTQVTISNGEVGEETYIVPTANFQVEPGQTIILETGLPEDYELSYALASAGKVEIVGNAMQYTAPDYVTPDVIYFSYYNNYSLKGYSRFYINRGEVATEKITISSAKQVPYYSAHNLDFTNLPDLKAYVATGYDKSTGVIWLTRVKQVPAETGFLLMGDPGDYEVPVSESASNVYYKNMFRGTLEGTTLYTTDGNYTNYYLSKGDAGVGFYKVTKAEGVSVGANRAYLPILTDIPANGSEGDTEVIKVSAAKQVPYFTSKNLDFTTMEAQGVKAYTATGYNYTSGVIWLTRVKQVPAQTGILVMADGAGDYNVPTASVQSVYENMFKGSETAQTIYTNETIGGVDYVNYYLSNGASGVSFYKVTNEAGVKMGANRSYLPIPKRDTASGARGKISETEAFCQMILSDEANDDVIAIPVFGGIDGAGDGTTGINSQFQNAEQDVYYNLQGQRVENPSKGVYIHNGRVVVIR